MSNTLSTVRSGTRGSQHKTNIVHCTFGDPGQENECLHEGEFRVNLNTLSPYLHSIVCNSSFLTVTTFICDLYNSRANASKCILFSINRIAWVHSVYVCMSTVRVFTVYMCVLSVCTRVHSVNVCEWKVLCYSVCVRFLYELLEWAT